uniref:Uncharacterized protein n=1 Tax=Anopheles albimanus TaxID=7167 RepID=A0A182FZ67_ANOAL
MRSESGPATMLHKRERCAILHQQQYARKKHARQPFNTAGAKDGQRKG